ncbi:hypothetical protein [Kingella sp. (in: b-proteobacteria)]|nr:hypothetical protein [Kingella sp. (in: b-proteobacteria)]MDO4657014.1 hypothetical protein [Kingella sp. (in: b-proteobacteria)]
MRITTVPQRQPEKRISTFQAALLFPQWHNPPRIAWQTLSHSPIRSTI